MHKTLHMCQSWTFAKNATHEHAAVSLSTIKEVKERYKGPRMAVLELCSVFHSLNTTYIITSCLETLPENIFINTAPELPELHQVSLELHLAL